MRLLHTSDWHLGRSFGAFSLLEDQRAAMARIAEVVRDRGVELVVVAGDVFDRAIPSVEAVVALREGLSAIRSAGAMVAVIAGNHDGAERLAAFDGLLADGVVVLGGYERAGEVCELTCSDGPLALVLLPYLDPLLAPERLARGDDAAGSERPTHASVLRARLQRARAAVGGRRSVVVAHAFVRGGWPSESERELGVGGSDLVDAEAFAGFGYVALGHLHRAQAVAGSAVLRYSGTPLAYSFSETGAKSVTLVEIGAGGSVDVELVELGVCRGVATIEGSLSDLLEDPRLEVHVPRWVRARVTDTGVLTEPMARLRARFPYVVELRRAPGATGSTERDRADEVGGHPVRRDPLDVAAAFWSEVHGEEPSREVRARLRHAIERASVPA